MNALKKALSEPATVDGLAQTYAPSVDPLPLAVEDGELVEVIGETGREKWRVKYVEELSRWVGVRVDPPTKYSGAWYDEHDIRRV